MTDQTDMPNGVLQKMIHQTAPEAAEVPLTASRAVRMAVTRAADQSVGMVLSVMSVGEEVVDLDALIAQVTDGHLITEIQQGGSVAGIVVVDPGFCSFIVEMQTIGKLGAKPATERAVTGVDAALIRPLLLAVLGELAQTTVHTSLDGWVADASVGARQVNARAAGFALPDQVYRLIRVTVDLGGDERQGMMMIALPPLASAAAEPTAAPAEPVDWNKEFRAAVMAAPACLTAVLHEFQMPLDKATQMEVGEVIQLNGCTVGKVRLVAPDGRTVVRGRLGQMAGQIAVRVEDEEPLRLFDLSQPGISLDRPKQLGPVDDVVPDAV